MLSTSSLSFAARGGLIASIGSVLIIALIAGLIVRLVRGDDFKRKDIKNAGLLNAFLYVGSFMLVGSMLMFMQDYPTAMPVVSIVATSIALLAGLLLYGLVDFLRPVGLAFSYTGLAILPFWFFAFHEFGCTPEVSFFLSALASTIGYIIVTIITKSQMGGWISYLWLLAFGACLPITGNAYAYTACLLPMLVALFALICWARRVKWLPVGFRQASSVMAYAAVPAVAFFIMPYFLVESGAEKAPLLRSLFFFLATVHYLVDWLIEKKRALLVVARILFQVFLIALISDITGYSFFNIHKENTTASVAIAIVWLAGSLIQTIISLFVKSKTEAEAKTERGMLAISLACIGITPLFCQGLPAQATAAIFFAMAIVVAILGVLITFVKKNLVWAFATLVAVLFTPFAIEGMMAIKWEMWVYYVIYALISTLALILYATVLRKVQVRCSFRLTVTAIIACAALGAFGGSLFSYDGSWPCIPIVIAAAQFALLGLASDRDECYELSIYSVATAVYFFIHSLGHYSYDARQVFGAPHYLEDAIFGLLLGGSLIGAGLIREKDKKNGVRQILGFILMSLIMFDAAAEGSSDNSQVAPLMLIGAELITMFIGLATDRKWMAIASACIVAFDVMFLMNSQNWLTFGIVGIGMIGIVVWMLAKNNRTPKTPAAPQQ